jgi:D-alanyl-D-alanine carboxypeptidase
MNVRQLLLVFFPLVSMLTSAGQTECVDSFLVDSTYYSVPELWCGLAVDSAMAADPASLVRIPEEYCYESYRIYVTPETRDAFVRMAQAATADSVNLIADSGYRSARFQERIFRRRLKEGESIEEILIKVAPPGYSEHQTGRAFDLVPSEAVFAHSEAYAWLIQHAAEFGFYETYPQNDSTSYPWEAWHWLYSPHE